MKKSDPILVSRYATALCNALETQEDILSALRTLQDVHKVFSPQLVQCLENPFMPLASQIQLLQEGVFQPFQLNPKLQAFFITILKNKRSYLILKILDAFFEKAHGVLGDVFVKITSAHQLEDSQLMELQKKLQDKIHKNIHLDVQYDSHLLAGLIIQIGQLRIDASLRSQLAHIQTLLET